MKHSPIRIVLLSALLAVGAAGAVAPAPKGAGLFDTAIKPLLEERCLDCHDEQTHKAGLRLDKLQARFSRREAAATWVNVFDKMVAGEMPPKKKERIPAAQLATATKLLHDAIASRLARAPAEEGARRRAPAQRHRIREHAARSARHQRRAEGDAARGQHGRRLRQRQQRARPLGDALPALPGGGGEGGAIGHPGQSADPVQRHAHRPGDDREGAELQARRSAATAKLEGDALVIYSKLPRYGLCSTASVPTAGRYKMQMSACAVGAEDKPIPVGFMTVEQSGRESSGAARKCARFPPGKPAVIEFEFDLDAAPGVRREPAHHLGHPRLQEADRGIRRARGCSWNG